MLVPYWMILGDVADKQWPSHTYGYIWYVFDGIKDRKTVDFVQTRP